jgi:putative tricarboxylic transport membrane protein
MSTERIGGVFWLVFGLVVMVGSFRLELGTFQAPGSGFLGFLAGGFVLLMAVIVLVQSFMGKDNKIKWSALWRDSKWWRPVTVALLILAYVLVLERLGFLLTSFLFMLTLFKWVEKFPWLKTVLVTLAVVVCSHLLFRTLLKASLPQGVLGF